MTNYTAAIAAVLALALVSPAQAHDIYSGLKDRRGAICCGDTDCSVTTYRERGSAYEFLTRENEWIQISEDHITFMAVPGDPPSDDSHHAHLCYRKATSADRSTPMFAANVFGDYYVYCSFIDPGGV